MVELDEDVVGAIYPRRAIDLAQLHANGGLPFAQAYAKSLSFVGNPGKPHPRNRDFRKVDSCGSGILLISRRCIESMLAACPDIEDSVRFKKMPYGSKFERFITPFNKILLEDRELSEDISFCHRWVNGCGGSIYAGVGFEIAHVGRLCIKAKWTDLEDS